MPVFGKYAKFITALVGIVAYVVGRHFGLNSEVYGDIVFGATALGVYAVPNKP